MGVGYRKERRGGSAQEEACEASMMEDSRVLGFLFGTDEMRACGVRRTGCRSGSTRKRRWQGRRESWA